MYEHSYHIDYGAPEYLGLELFVASRASGLPLETPGVRRYRSAALNFSSATAPGHSSRSPS